MKKIVALFSVALSVLGAAQTDIVSDRLPAQPVLANDSAPILVRIVDNKWGRESDIFADRQLTALVAEILSSHGWSLAADTQDILQEASERRAMAADEYVDDSSPVFRKKSIKPAEYIVELTTGGSSDSHSASGGVRIGGYQIGGSVEGGSSTAWITAVIRKRDTFTTVAVVTGRSTYKSINIDDADISRSWGWSSLFRFDRDNDNPEYRRGMISIGRALEDLNKKLQKVFTSR